MVLVPVPVSDLELAPVPVSDLEQRANVRVILLSPKNEFKLSIEFKLPNSNSCFIVKSPKRLIGIVLLTTKKVLVLIWQML